ncbi:Ldh family oxidoreductase [Nocardia sp. SC052]|uniref:Ldh family oxidoreductase n=1 Tax=Nocardia sichangensis TaxID=3385975 RepID=UPI0039A36DEA
MNDVVVVAESLHACYRAAFEAMGVPSQHSFVCADGLHYADLHGIKTHGAQALNRLYLRMLRDREVDPAAVPTVVSEHGGTCVVDGGNGVGFVAAEFALRQAMFRAGEYGVAAVAVRNSSHCGCMGWYTATAAEQGMIALASTNCGTQGLIPPPGGRDRLLGTNVVAAGAPAASMAAFNLDMSAAVVAAGRVRMARDEGRAVPAGWLADDDGDAVTDPSAYFDGRARLQFLGGSPVTGGYKGYGLAILADTLSGVLGGAGVGPVPHHDPTARADADIGHFFLAIDVTRFRADFHDGMDTMLRALVDSTPVERDRPVTYPGLPESRYRAGLSGTISLPSAVAVELSKVAEELGVPGPEVVP